jgi:uncharacterized protein (TIGR02996 family)
MDEEQAFLRAISAAPDDNTVRLIYADWLEERDDPRAEFVRAQVHLRELAPDDPAGTSLRVWERELRAGCPPYWLAMLDPPVWCAVGNIADVRPTPPGQPERRGTRLFRPNSKVLLATRSHWYALLDPILNADARIEVIGQHRKSREWIECWVAVSVTAYWRVQLVRHPGAKVRLREAGWLGFCLRPHEFPSPAEPGSVGALRALFEAIHARFAAATEL